MDTVYFVDWLSVVFDWTWMNVPAGFEPTNGEAALAGYILTRLGAWTRCKPRFGYSLAWREPIAGTVMQYSPSRPDMGVNVIWTGQTLAKLDWRETLRLALDKSGRVTRLDLTVDVHDANFDLRELSFQHDAGLTLTKARSHRFVVSESGATLYIGGRSSGKYIRVYDKGGEQGDEQGVYIRIELECKSEAARFVAPLLLELDDNTVLGVITGYFDAPSHPGWVTAMGSAHAAIRVPSEKRRPDTEAWLMGMVARTMAAAERRTPGLLDAFFDEVVNLL